MQLHLLTQDATGVDIDPAFGNWFAGFADGEGSFNICRNQAGSYVCQFSISLRCDDIDVLHQIAERTGLGKVKTRAKAGKNSKGPPAEWTVCRQAEAFELMRTFDRFPLRAKKARDYAVWREGVLEWARAKGRPYFPRDWSRMAELKQQLQDGRKYIAQ